MEDSIIYIINNKLYEYKYINYTIVFIITILYSYYSLYISLLNNNYYIIAIYFSIIMISYIKYNKFSYIIGLVYLLTYEFFNNHIFKHNIIEANSYDRAEQKSKKSEQEMKDSAENTDSTNNPCESYITNRLIELGVKVKSNKHSAPKAEATPANAPTIDTMKIPTFTPLDLRT